MEQTGKGRKPRPRKGPRPRSDAMHRSKRSSSNERSTGTGRLPASRKADERKGIAARRLAIGIVEAVLRRHQTLDDALAQAFSQEAAASLEQRDRAFTRLLSTTMLRRHGQVADVVGRYLERSLPKDASRVRTILEVGAAQLLFLDVPPHAVIDTAVTICGGHKRTFRFRGLVNAVLRRIGETGREIVAGQDAAVLNTPDWLLSSWATAYGAETAHRIAAASLEEPSLDLTPKTDGAAWAEKLSGKLLPTGSIRCALAEGRIDDKPGYSEGAWWIQDFAAALPARLFGPLEGRSIADVCAAPGGKTAQLAAGGANVIAVDQSSRRLGRLCANLARLKLDARTVTADVLEWRPDGPLDGILLDAPCSATGTIRRHPDILHLKKPDQIASLAQLQADMLRHVAEILPACATLVYCTCSLQPEEGPQQISSLLAARPDLARVAITPDDVGGLAEILTAVGDVRTLPHHKPSNDDPETGMDGFYISRLQKKR